MKITLAASGPELSSAPGSTFARSPYFLQVDLETDDIEVVANPTKDATGGAGVMAAQRVVDSGAAALVATRVGPRAWEVLSAAKVEMLEAQGETLEDVVAAYRAGRLHPLQAGPARHEEQP